MKPSLACVDLITQFEGCKLNSYQDQGGIWTIGYGNTRNVGPKMFCTLEEAHEWLDDDIREHAEQIDKVITVTVSQNQFDALVSFVFNVGFGNFFKSSLLQKLNEKNYLGAADEFLRWDKIHGIEIQGLLNRRKAERELFLEG